MRNTADVTGGKLIAVLLQSISGVSVINPLVVFYDIYGGKREVLFLYFVPDTTRDIVLSTLLHNWQETLVTGLVTTVSTNMNKLFAAYRRSVPVNEAIIV
jgi:hypothetical protein